MSFKKKPWKQQSNYSNTNTLDTFMDLDNISIAPSEAPSEFDTRKKIKYGNPTQAAWGIFSEYCNNSTIHGIKYLGEQKRPCLERLFWVFVFVLSIYACSRLTMNIWEKWDTNPVIVSFAEKSTPVWEIPFPAVTICPETKARKADFDFTNVYYDFVLTGNASSEKDYINMEAISQICDYHIMTGISFGHETVSSKVIDDISDLTVSFNSTFLICKWRNRIMNCSDLFHKVLTEDGICYTFNSLDATEIFRPESIHDDYIFEKNFRQNTDWDLEEGYRKDSGTITFPERVLGAGARAGLFLVVMGLEKEYDYLCRGPVPGFKILLHTPGEIPRLSRQYFRIPLRQEVLVSIRPNMITTSDGLKHYSPHRRQCFFNTERYLRFFQVYTQTNCELECLANFTLNKCGCVKFSMPRAEDTPICGAQNLQCYDSAEDILIQEEFMKGLDKIEGEVKGRTRCDCLPACTSIVYDAEISQADYNSSIMFDIFEEDDPLKEYTMSRFSIFFKENQFLTSKRSELYGTTDFLANCGGLLGLFMGVSTLSLVELLYFCTVRLCTNLKMRHERLKKLREKKQRKMHPNCPEIIIREPSYDSGKDM